MMSQMHHFELQPSLKKHKHTTVRFWLLKLYKVSSRVNVTKFTCKMLHTEQSPHLISGGKNRCEEKSERHSGERLEKPEQANPEQG